MPSGGNNRVFCKEVAEKVLIMVAEGTSLKVIADAVGVHVSSIARWRLENDDFHRLYSQAQEIGFELEADSLKTIADEYVDVNKARLKSDNLKWLLARRAPGKYGDRLDVNVTQSLDINSALNEARRRVRPSGDLQQSVDAEIVETKQLSSEGTSGSRPVDASNSKLTGTDGADDDIFS